MPDQNGHLKNLHKIFYPQSVAIVGANRVPGTVPHDIILNILKSDFQGIVYPVSPREKFIAGVKSYKYVVDIEDPVDLAIIVFPSSVCHMALEQCGKKGIKSVIVISAGFKEIGGAGIEREEQLKKIAEKYGMSFIGPNCLGVINTDSKTHLNASFARKMPEEGNIGFLSQSGALCTAVLDYAQAKHIGFSKFVSFGNKADITEIDLLYYLGDDPKTKVILLYLEEISNGPALMEAARDVISKTGKPILAIKSGRTSEGASAAASHTGSLAGSDEICEAALAQAGVIRCTNIEEMFNKAIAFAYQPLPQNNRVAIITNAGGPGVLTTDAAMNAGLELAKFSEKTTTMFKKTLPKTANIKNPVDVIGDARSDRYNIAVSQAMQDPNVDGVFVILTPQSMTDIDTIAHEICNVAQRYDKPIYTSFMGQADVASGIDILQRNKIPHYILPESMTAAFATTHNFKRMLEQEHVDFKDQIKGNKAEAHRILDTAKKDHKPFLAEAEASRVLKAYGLPVFESIVAKSHEEAVEFAAKVGYPVVLKIISKDIVHKYDMGGVMLDISDEKALRESYDRILKNVEKHHPEADIEGILIRKMIPEGEEIIIGIKRDVSFGPVIMLGFGGIFVEVLKDVTFRVVPLERSDAESMLREIRASKLLYGVRGRPERDVDALIDAIHRLSQLAADCPQIQELDINPLLILEKGKGCFVADAKIML